MKPDITVAIPLWNAGPIAWLAFESLARQQTHFKWEVIVMEENSEFNPNPVSAAAKRTFYDQLSHCNNCVQHQWFTLNRKTPLMEKWKKLAMLANGETFILQSADCYSHPQRLHRTHQAMLNGADWYQNTQGVFYHLKTGQQLLFKRQVHPCGLNMATLSSRLMHIEAMDIPSAIDFRIYKQIRPRRRYEDHDLFLGGVDTHGLNTISRREGQFNNPTPPFHQSDHILHLPEDITTRLRAYIAI